MSAWTLNVLAGLYLSLLFLVHKDLVSLTLWLLGFLLLSHYLRRTR